MERDWARLGAALKAAREARGLSQAELGERIGVKRGAMRNIERGLFSKVTHTVRSYAREVGWDTGSIDAVLAGGDPTPAETAPEAPDERAALNIASGLSIETAHAEELPLRIQAALSDGPLLDSLVINLPGDDDENPDAQMVIVVKGRPGVGPEQVRRALERWEQMEARIRRLKDDQ
ncbi:helix-turn-helix transcriptional regulator [Streptomyces sp. NPDC019937]|uniref:helix-turn-helix domain-containing protein n=1 Tax=Streptomyces sp. NPDC019937 TaxID=3154787 RepID=UPI0033C924BA